jgi:hypothetical protein
VKTLVHKIRKFKSFICKIFGIQQPLLIHGDTQIQFASGGVNEASEEQKPASEPDLKPRKCSSPLKREGDLDDDVHSAHHPRARALALVL